MPRTVTIDCFRRQLRDYPSDCVVVAVDVMRATTTAITAVTSGRRCFPVPDLDTAAEMSSRLPDPVLSGELGGNVPFGFDLDNSPAEVANRTDTHRPLVLLSTSGTHLMAEAAQRWTTYAACLRNYSAQAEYLIRRHHNVAIVGAGTRGEFREEDQLCCAWIADALIDAGYTADADTLDVVRRWASAPATDLLVSKSVTYLRVTGRDDDLNFIMSHIDDVRANFTMCNGEVLALPAAVAASYAAGGS
jgi:2-phosphosulfolactate phosphatase